MPEDQYRRCTSASLFFPGSFCHLGCSLGFLGVVSPVRCPVLPGVVPSLLSVVSWKLDRVRPASWARNALSPPDGCAEVGTAGLGPALGPPQGGTVGGQHLDEAVGSVCLCLDPPFSAQSRPSGLCPSSPHFDDRERALAGWGLAGQGRPPLAPRSCLALGRSSPGSSVVTSGFPGL